MKTLTAFVAKSFRDEDHRKTDPIEQFLGRFRKLGLIWRTAEPAEVESVSQKVRTLIDNCDIFVGILTRRHPLFQDVGGLRKGLQVALNRIKPFGWSAPPWVLQESGYALNAAKPLILFRELDVDIGVLQGDLEYILYDPQHPDRAFAKATEMINDLIAREGQIVVKVITEAAEPPGQPLAQGEAPTVDVPSVQQGDDHFSKAFDQLLSAINTKNLEAAAEAYQAGLVAIDPTDEAMVLDWKLLYASQTYKIGSQQALADLADIQQQHPTDPRPTAAVARCYERFQQHDKAAENYERAANIATGDVRSIYRVRSAGCLREAKKPTEARSRLEQVLRTRDISLGSRIAALKELYAVLNALGLTELACAIGELVLLDNPGDEEFRFALGYDYLERHPPLAAHHYELLCACRPEDSVALNNLGYAYKKIGLMILATRKYRRAADLKEARAFRNLGLTLVDAGFADEALTLLGSVGNIADTDGLVLQAASTVHEQIANQQDKREEVLESTRQHREFLSKMGAALLEDLPTPIEGDWSFPIAVLTLSVDGKTVLGEGIMPPNALKQALMRSFGGQYSDAAQEPRVTSMCTFSGDLSGRVCRFEVASRTLYENAFIPDETGHTIRGYILFDPQGTVGEVGEYEDENLARVYQIQRVGRPKRR